MQGFSLDQRTCKHLKEFLGEEFDNYRRGAGENAEGHKEMMKQPAAKRPKKEAAPPLLLAEKWDHIKDMKGWFCSEKLDGVRALWDGEKFVSRLGLFVCCVMLGYWDFCCWLAWFCCCCFY